MPIILSETKDQICTITLNRPEAMNALSVALRAAIAEEFTKANDDPNVRVIIVTGAGNRAFTAGLDLKELGSEAGALGSQRPAGQGGDPHSAMKNCKKPIIGAINGVAITGGFELALACDVLIASTNARFADTHARVGIIPGWGLSQKLSRVIGIYKAKELSLTGNFLDAQTALEWGLVNRVVPPEELLPTCHKLALDMISIPADFSYTYKKLIDEGFDMNFGDSMKLEQERTRAGNAGVKPEDVEARRKGILERGRTQTS